MGPGDRRCEIELVRANELAALLGVSRETLDGWVAGAGFPKPVYIVRGSPARWRLAEILRWLDGRARSRRRRIKRGRLRRGTAMPADEQQPQ